MITELKEGEVYEAIVDDRIIRVLINTVTVDSVTFIYDKITRGMMLTEELERGIRRLNCYGYKLISFSECQHSNTKQIQLFTSYINVCIDCGKDI